MMKFFRSIRKRLLSQNKLGKYLIYASGEVLLIIIGILLALQLSNLNDGAKEDKLANQFLERLVSDLAQDTTYCSQRIKAATRGVNSAKVFVNDMYQTQRMEEEVSQ